MLVMFAAAVVAYETTGWHGRRAASVAGVVSSYWRSWWYRPARGRCLKWQV